MLQCPSLTALWPPQHTTSGKKWTAACAASSPLPQPCTPPAKPQRRAISRAQALKLLLPVDRDILTTVTVSRHIYVSGGSYSCPIPVCHPQKPRQTFLACPGQSATGHSIFLQNNHFPTQETVVTYPRGRSRDSYPLSLHFLTSTHHTPANTDRPNPA